MDKKHSVSVIITTSRELHTISQSIEAVLPQLSPSDELLIISPDNLGGIVKKYNKRNKHVRWIRDKGKGKPSALNLGFQKVHGDILILSDGDVFINKDALSYLTEPFGNVEVGAVSGHPVSIEKKDRMFGFWSHLLTDTAHQMRLRKSRENKFLECSGYLYAIRKGIVNRVPEDALAEDAVISHIVADKGLKIKYAPQATVYVKYPKNYKDWLRQKVRSSGGYTQTYVTESPHKMRTPLYEILSNPSIIIRYPEGFKEVIWTMALFLARVHLWILVAVKLHFLRQTLPNLWLRVESTK
ncbi:hypothetical protein A2686_05135 [Candidatus Woesebacteria bacterium RIFCSPHIGHO2_01_FULL_38_10]|nr:MAG: hypothetical protein A2686_05135 [Candidatus Woesebacteria bacterium RIFCSPHIGHO2_01_FULL_38_10]